MEIKIDTTKDSKEEIKKTIEFLSKLVDHDYINNSSGSSEGEFSLAGLEMDNSEPETPKEEPASGGMFNMFDNPPETNEEVEPENKISIHELDTY